MTAYTSHVHESRGPRSPRERIAALLGRYPNLTDAERQEVLSFMTHGRHLEIGLLTSDEKVRPQLEAFMADHKRHFRIGVADVAWLFGVLAAVVMFLWLLWELVRPVAH